MQFTDEPLESFGEKLLEMNVPSELSFKTPVVFRITKELQKQGCLPWTGSHRAELCVDEAITNAIVHGNKHDAAKMVHVELFSDGSRWGLIVQDEGEGFKQEDVPDPSSPDFIYRESGRGILLMNSYLDELLYSRKGNRLRMVRKRQTEPDEAEVKAALEPEVEAAKAAGPVGVERQGDIEIVEVLSERITDENATAVRQAVLAAAERSKKVMLDVSRVTYISSVGIGALVAMHKTVSGKAGRLILAGMQPGVADIMKSAHLLQLFTTAVDRPSAVRELNKAK